MSESSRVAPHVQPSGGSSPLSDLCVRALRRFGNFAPYSGDEDVLMMFLEMANEIVEDVRAHPYWQSGQIDYYTDIEEVRPIPDQIVINGILFKFSEQQMSEKARLYGPKYFSTMSQILWERLNGNAPINVHVVDQPSSFIPQLRSMLSSGG